MFQQCSEDHYAACSESGVRHLFRLGQYQFQDTLDDEGDLHHFVLETTGDSDETLRYEVDYATMYELMARFLAGEYEKEQYHLDRSPGHEALADALEMATARARAGETEFDFDDLDRGEVEVIDPDLPTDPDAEEEEP